MFTLEQQTHLVLAQYHRWYQVYEVPFTKERIDNQKDILSDDVEIISQSGTTKGKDGLEDRLKIFTGWKNAHHVQKTDVRILTNGILSLEADIIYQNIRPDDTKACYNVHYSTLLRPRENDLPLFTKVELKPTGIIENFSFEGAYIENRSKSFVHYWLYLMENLPGNESRFKELLAPGFTLHMTAGTVTTFEMFERWMKDVQHQVKTSTHTVKNFRSYGTHEEIRVSVDFEWKGIKHDDNKMIAETHHEWTLTNNADERFARMKEMTVHQTKPFQVVERF